MDTIIENLPLLLPIFLVQLSISIFGLVHLKRYNVKMGIKPIWAFIIIFGGIVGTIVYFWIGREVYDNSSDDE